MFLIKQRKEELLLLQFHWRPPLVSDLWFERQTSQAVQLAEDLSGSCEPAFRPLVHISIQEDEEYNLRTDCLDNEACLAQDVLEVIEHCDSVPDEAGCEPRSPVPPPTQLPVPPMIERGLRLYSRNPVCTVIHYMNVLR